MRAADRILAGGRQVTALLGPTNTGKTHRAIQAMLRHPSGMIGLPLRLLAREVYDRVVALKGVDQVALVTGEEKRVPAAPAYFVCTVEAMPLDRTVAFLAVDEIQLAGDRNRGHVFTDRLLNARGVLETMFLGSDTIEPLLTELVPEAQVERMPRLSRLSWGGTHRLARVPRRSAVVAFSAEQVYRNAERLRSTRGGVAVVLGALSPRTRNAQVELYESGQVQHLVATDAIGMGLNMDIGHVAFAGLRKFDGRRFRDLRVDEIAQIAGRAGRHKVDGTFGTLRSVGALEPEVIEALVTHDFRPLNRLFWRNSSLDFASVPRLLQSLRIKPPHPQLKAVYDEDDHKALEDLAERGDLPVEGQEAVRILWEVCRIPDYRKTLTGSHADLLHRIAGHLLRDRGSLPEDWVAKRLDQLDRPQGDIDALMTRIAFVRTWTYVTHQKGWIDDPEHWQAKTRMLEDRLSDALHEALRRRFVGESRERMGRTSVIESDPEEEARTAAILAGGELAIAPDGRIWWGDVAIGGLFRGSSIHRPRVLASRKAFPTPARRTAVREHIEAFVTEQLGRFTLIRTGTPAADEVLQELEAGLGSCSRERLRNALRQLDGEGRARLEERGVTLGKRFAWVADLLEPRAVALRSTLWSVWREEPGRIVPGGAPSEMPRTPEMPEEWLSAIGYVSRGDTAVRVDAAELSGRKGATR